MQGFLAELPPESGMGDLTLQNLQALLTEIDRTTDPTRKAILQAEFERLRDMAANSMPKTWAPEPPDNDVQRGAFDPQNELHRWLQPYPGRPSRIRM